MIRQILKQGTIKNQSQAARAYFSQGKERQGKKKQNKSGNRVSIDNAVNTIENKFNFKLKSQTEPVKKTVINNPYRARNQTEQPITLPKHEQNQEQYLQQSDKNSQQLQEKTKGRKQNLLSGLKKVEGQKETFNSIFKSNEMSYLDQQFKTEAEKKKQSDYQVKRSQETENGIDGYDVPSAVKNEISSFIHQQDTQLESQVMAYLGFSEINTKEEKIEQWRRAQVIQNMDYTPETMGTKEVFYPGSKKGRFPIDDMESFGEWYKQNMPQPFQLILEDLNQLSEIRARDSNVPNMLKPFVGEGSQQEHFEQDDVDIEEMNQPGDYGSAPAENNIYVSELNALCAPEIDDMPKAQPFEVLENMIFEDDSEIVLQDQTSEHELPILPEFMKADHHSSVDLIDKWSIFRLFPIIQHGERQLNDIWRRINLGENFGKKVVMPTLYAYYNLLPEQVMHHPIVKTTVRNLEYYKHDMTLQDKYLAVNFACRMTMPMHPLVEEVCNDILSTEKYWITAAEEDTLLQREGPLENVSDHADVQSQEIEQLDKSLQVQDEWARPKQRDPEGSDEVVPDLPLQYYDNDDGFWDWHIQEQDQLYEEVELPQFRPFFKH